MKNRGVEKVEDQEKENGKERHEDTETDQGDKNIDEAQKWDIMKKKDRSAMTCKYKEMMEHKVMGNILVDELHEEEGG